MNKSPLGTVRTQGIGGKGLGLQNQWQGVGQRPLPPKDPECHAHTVTHSRLSHPAAGVALGDQAVKGNNPSQKGKEGEVGKGLRTWTQEEPEVAGKRFWNLLGSQAPLPPILSIPEPYTATPFVAWELRVLISRRPAEQWGSEQSPGSLRQLHEKTSWEGQKHLDRCVGGDKWAAGEAPTSVPGLWELLPFPQWLQTPLISFLLSSGFDFSALFLPMMASYQ